MIKYTKLGGIATALLSLALSASAEIKLNDNLSTSGYIVGSNQYTNKTIDGSDGLYKKNSYDLDAAKVLFNANFKQVTSTVSFFYNPALPVVTVLDAYVGYDLGNGVSLSGGKFLSWLGYEAFDAINMYQISYANNDFLGAIPGYHSGARIEYSNKEYGSGFAVLDSVYANGSGGSGFYKGDGEFRYNQGYEGYFTYKGVPDVTFFAGFAYESHRTNESWRGVHNTNTPAILTLDFWTSYQVQKDLLVAAEFTHKNGDHQGQSGYNWLFLSNYTFTPKISTAFRISGEHIEGYQLSGLPTSSSQTS